LNLFPYEIIIDTESKNYFKIKNLGVETIPINIIVGEENYELLLTSSEVLNPYVETYITLLDKGTFRLMPTLVCKPIVPAFNYTIQALPPPPGYTKETVKAEIAEVNIAFIHIDLISNIVENHTIDASVSEVTIVLTKVGTEPI